MKIQWEPSDCPLRNVDESCGKCNIVKNMNHCESFWNAYPVWCPLLSDDVTVCRYVPESKEEE